MFLLAIKLKSVSLVPLIDFLVFVVQKLWPKHNKLYD